MYIILGSLQIHCPEMHVHILLYLIEVKKKLNKKLRAGNI